MSNNNTIKCKITVEKKGDQLQPVFDPEYIPVDENDSIITFRLVSTPDNIIIDSVAISPADQDQLSPPSISPNGRLMTLSDLNTVKETLVLTFTFKDKNSGRVFGNASTDVTAKAVAAKSMGVDVPQIINNPP